MTLRWGYRIYTLPIELTVAPPSEVARYMAQHSPNASAHVLYEEAQCTCESPDGSKFNTGQVESVLERDKFLGDTADGVEEIQAACGGELARRPLS